MVYFIPATARRCRTGRTGPPTSRSGSSSSARPRIQRPVDAPDDRPSGAPSARPARRNSSAPATAISSSSRRSGETDEALRFGRDKSSAFSILLVLSEINWRPLDDFYRPRQDEGKLVFEEISTATGTSGSGPGGAAGEALLSGRGGGASSCGDGWRVPYWARTGVDSSRGGRPHGRTAASRAGERFRHESAVQCRAGSASRGSTTTRSSGSAGRSPRRRSTVSGISAPPSGPSPSPRLRPGRADRAPARPAGRAQVASLRVRVQTDVLGPWVDVPTDPAAPQSVRWGGSIGPPPSATGSMRARGGRASGAVGPLPGPRETTGDAALRVSPVAGVRPHPGGGDGAGTSSAAATGEPVDLLSRIDVARDTVQGKWTLEDGILESPERLRGPDRDSLRAPCRVPDDRGGRAARRTERPDPWPAAPGTTASLTLVNSARRRKPFGARERGREEREGEPHDRGGAVAPPGEPSQVIVTVRKTGVEVSVDGRRIIDWEGARSALSLSDYWTTPNAKHPSWGVRLSLSHLAADAGSASATEPESVSGAESSDRGFSPNGCRQAQTQRATAPGGPGGSPWPPEALPC